MQLQFLISRQAEHLTMRSQSREFIQLLLQASGFEQ